MNWIAPTLVGMTGLIVLAAALVVAATLWPRDNPFRANGLTPKQHRDLEIANGVVFEQTYPFRETPFVLRDGASIAVRLFGADTARDVIVLVHGIGSAGERWTNPAGLLSGTAGAQVAVVDLRGHNASSGKRYDLDRFGQYEDDLAEIIEALRQTRPAARFWLAGHSMGGGIALRYALKPDRPRLSGYVLFAPYFGPGPTEPDTPQDGSPLHVDRLRVTGLILFNMLGVKAFNHLPVAHVNAPPDYPSYSFRAIASGLPMPPLTAADGLKAMEGKVLVIAGDADTAIHTPGYRQVAAPCPQVRVEILPGHGHDSFLNDQATHDLVAAFMDEALQTGSRTVSGRQAVSDPEKAVLTGN